MGLNIREIIVKQNIEPSDLNGRIICVDAFNALYQFLSTIRQYDGTPLMDENGNITSHLSGIFYRNVSLMSEGIKLVYVFDGKAPELKGKTHQKRGENRATAKKRFEEAKQKEDFETMKRYSSQLVRLEDSMIEESKDLLEAMGIQVIQAPSEGEAQASFLSKKEEIYGTVSQDYDSLLFGTPFLIRNLTISRRKKTASGYIEVKPEIIELKKFLKKLEINQDQLICLGILVGTDYNPKGIPRIGQKKALQIVKEHKTPEKIFDSVKEKMKDLEEKDKFNWREIFELFKNPKVKDSEIKIPEKNLEKIKEILVTRHNFSEERVEKQIEKLTGIKKPKNQKSLDKWF